MDNKLTICISICLGTCFIVQTLMMIVAVNVETHNKVFKVQQDLIRYTIYFSALQNLPACFEKVTAATECMKVIMIIFKFCIFCASQYVFLKNAMIYFQTEAPKKNQATYAENMFVSPVFWLLIFEEAFMVMACLAGCLICTVLSTMVYQLFNQNQANNNQNNRINQFIRGMILPGARQPTTRQS